MDKVKNTEEVEMNDGGGWTGDNLVGAMILLRVIIFLFNILIKWFVVTGTRLAEHSTSNWGLGL